MKCILCGNKNYKKLFNVGDFEIKKCGSCSLVRTFGSTNRNYQEYHRDSDYKKFEEHFKNIFQKRFNLVRRKKETSGRVLEIGCSTGILLKIFKDNGWEAWGVEPSASAKRAKRCGLKIIKTTFEKAKLPNNYFDVVIMNHVLEHMDDPLSAIRKTKKLLKKSGILYIDVPNFGSLSSVIGRENWKYVLPEEHIHHFTKKTLSNLLEKAGFKIIYKRTWSGIFDVANPVKKLFYEAFSRPFVFIATILDIPGNVIATILNRGTNLVVMGEKR